jgi:hypothetical protein
VLAYYTILLLLNLPNAPLPGKLNIGLANGINRAPLCSRILGAVPNSPALAALTPKSGILPSKSNLPRGEHPLNPNTVSTIGRAPTPRASRLIRPSRFLQTTPVASPALVCHQRGLHPLPRISSISLLISLRAPQFTAVSPTKRHNIIPSVPVRWRTAERQA